MNSPKVNENLKVGENRCDNVIGFLFHCSWVSAVVNRYVLSNWPRGVSRIGKTLLAKNDNNKLRFQKMLNKSDMARRSCSVKTGSCFVSDRSDIFKFPIILQQMQLASVRSTWNLKCIKEPPLKSWFLQVQMAAFKRDQYITRWASLVSERNARYSRLNDIFPNTNLILDMILDELYIVHETTKHFLRCEPVFLETHANLSPTRTHKV